MKKIIGFLIEERLLVNLFIIISLVVGLITLRSFNRETISETSLDMVTITTIFPGATASEAEELITIPVEKKLRSVSGLKKVRGYNVDNVSLIVVFLEDPVKDKRKTIQNIKDAVEQTENLPGNAKKPVVAEVNFENTPLVSLAITGKNENVPYSKLRELAKKLEDFIYDVHGVAEIKKYGYYDREYLVEIDPEVLDKYRIGMNTIINTLKMRNIDIPGGALRIKEKELILRTKGQFKNIEEVKNTVIRGNDTGYVLKIGDIAKVTDTYKEADVYHRLNGKQAIIFEIWKKGSADQIDLSHRINEALSSSSFVKDKDVEFTFFNDQSIETEHRIEAVIEEAVIGFIILGIFMLMLLGSRMSILVLAGIPITFMLTFISMKYFGMTINILSLFGMIMVMGIMVDFSIVIAENSHRLIEEGVPKRNAVERGVLDVFWAVTVTLICIIAAFVPLLLLSGMMGKFIVSIPIVIISALVAGWVVAMFILPNFLNMFLKKPKHTDDQKKKFSPFKWIQNKYQSLLRFTLKHRYITVTLLIALLPIIFVMAAKMGFKFIPSGGEQEIRIAIIFPFDINLESNRAEMKKIEKTVSDTLLPEEYKSIHTIVGEDYVSLIDPKPGKASYKSHMEIYLVPEKDRKRTAYKISSDIRKSLEEAQANKVLSQDGKIKVETIFKGPPVGKPINVEIRGENFEVMKEISEKYEKYLETIDGVQDIYVDLEKGKTEYQYTVNEKMAAWTNVSVYDIGTTLNASYMGVVASNITKDKEEIGVRVRFEEEARKKMKGLNEVKIDNMRGGLVPLVSVSDFKETRGYSHINRLNYKRIIQVQADVDIKKITPNEVNKILEEKFSDIGKQYPEYSVFYGGEQEDSKESMSELVMFFLGAIIFIFIVITLFTRSLVLPAVVMVAIPFALIGVVLALYIHGQPLTFMSFLGLFSLAGIIVSNTLVLVQFINNFRDEGLNLFEAIVKGGTTRFRPIILTAGAMVLELIPVMYGLGGSKDYFVSPLALAFGYGLVFATIITLILIPCFYHIAEDGQKLVSKLLAPMGIKINETIYKSRVAK